MKGRKSIRWRLPLSFLGIAGLTVVILGIVLLVILRGHYQRVERDFLHAKAEEVYSGILPIFEASIPSDAVSVYLDNLSFLTQTRIRVQDAQGVLLADTGSPQDFNLVLRLLDRQQPQSEGRDDLVFQPFIIIDKDDTSDENLVITPSASGDTFTDENERIAEFPSRLPETDEMDRKLVFIPQVSDEPLGYNLGITLIFEGSRSQQKLQLAYYNDEGDLLGFVELLEGPAYGQTMLNSVFVGLLLAGGLSILLAGAAGFWISHRLSHPILALSKSSARIADGEYASRVDIDRQDELGLLARTFNRMAERVEGTVSTLRRFVSDAAHELNTPLTALRTNLDLAKTERKVSLRNKYLEQAVEQAKRLEHLSNALLDISRLEAKMDQKEMVQLDLTGLLRDLSERYASRAEQSEIDFQLDLPEDSTVLKGNETQLRRAFENLLDNALKFTDSGGEVGLGLRREADIVSIWVEDRGIGIPENELPHLFQRFHRAPNAYGYPGSGLGLVIVKTIIEGHGGSVQVENRAHGTRFTCRLPITE